MTFLAIVVATFVSEDLTCVAAGLLIARGELDWLTGTLGCFVGILVGDLGLWVIGRFTGRTLLRWRWVQQRISRARIDELAGWFERRGWQAVLGARFLPGARFPVYVGAGMLGARAGKFLVWAATACLLWTPLLVGSVAIGGERLADPLRRFFGGGWTGVILPALMLVLTVRMAVRLSNARGRAQVWARLSRVKRWEFWPAWLFYIPVVPWIAWLAWRRRGFSTITAANPAIPHGGIVGESKYDILQNLPAEWVVSTDRIEAGSDEQRERRLHEAIHRLGLCFPVILKPDVGERGAGLKLARNMDEALEYLRRTPAAVLIQRYHPGPFEAGVFYYRLPGEPAGRIFSITDKRFPVLAGNGESTVEDLIWRHPRFRMQADRFLARLNGQAKRVLGSGELLRLAVAGNHCQGTEFRDGGHLITPQLEQRIDEIARSFEGFYFGRFDVRYADLQAFAAGRDFAIVELNGASSESTDLYDPDRSLIGAYRILFRQWRLLFEVGHRNRSLGRPVTPLPQLLRVIHAHYRNRNVSLLAD